jgi:hypothetical protein
MSVNAPGVESGAAWFSMIVNYLQLKSMAVWFNLHPESSYEQFESVWPCLLDQMMMNATRCCIEQLHSLVHISVN